MCGRLTTDIPAQGLGLTHAKRARIAWHKSPTGFWSPTQLHVCFTLGQRLLPSRRRLKKLLEVTNRNGMLAVAVVGGSWLRGLIRHHIRRTFPAYQLPE